MASNRIAVLILSFVVAFPALCASQTTVSVSPSSDLASVLGSASAGTIIDFEAGTYNNACDLTVSTSLIFRASAGQTRTILDCSKTQRHLHVTGQTVELNISGVAFKNGDAGAGGGGCILVEGGATVRISNSSFAWCTAVQGAAVAVQDKSAFYAQEVDFQAIRAVAFGGAIYVYNSTASVTSSSFTNCHANVTGGAIWADGTAAIEVSSTTFTDNQAYSGGAIYLGGASSLVTTSCSFSANMAGHLSSAPAVEGSGGAICVAGGSTIVVQDGSFTANSAYYMGGAIFVNAGCAADISGTAQFTSNWTPTRGGGAVTFVASHGSITGDVAFIGNHAGNIAEPNVKLVGGGVFNTYGSMVISGSVKFIGNYAFIGGGMLCNFCNMQMSGAFVSQNMATYVGGGVFVIENAVATVTDSELSDNMCLLPAVTLQGLGGGYFAQASTSTITRTTIQRNMATYGAGLGLYGGTLTMVDSKVLDNMGHIAAGIEYALAHTSSFTRTEFKGNIATVEAGVLRMTGGSSIVAEAVVFEGNLAGAQGGAIYSTDAGTLDLNYTTFRSNVAGDGGGAVSLQSGSVMTCVDCTVESNVGGSAGGIEVYATLRMTRGSFVGNSASGKGGCVGASGFGIVEINSTTFEGCVAGGHGGAVMSEDSSELWIEGCPRMSGCSAGGHGGGIYANGASMSVGGRCLELVDNSAAEQGGGLYYATQVSLLSGVVTVDGNSAYEGGGVCGNGWGGEVSIGGVCRLLVTNNIAEMDGGGVALTALSRMSVDRGECPSSCATKFADGQCDWDCMRAGCNFDGGDCNFEFTTAGTLAQAGCDRNKCLHALEHHGSKCYDDCMTASCDWSEGSGPCSGRYDLIAQCPFLEAHAYVSYANTVGLQFVGDAGTAEGWGRCAEACQSTAPPAYAAWSTGGNMSAGGTWCTVIDDAGLKYKPDCPTCSTTQYSALGTAWGDCVAKPRLPTFDFNYVEADMAALTTRAPFDLFSEHAGCGKIPLAVEGNMAGRNGGGFFKESCNIVQHRADECFVEGTEGSTLISFNDNAAGAAGGGVYVGCHSIGSCDGTLALPFSTARRSSSSFPKLSYSGNTAGTFGGDVGANALNLVVERATAAYVPGQSLLNLSLALTDALGQRMQSPSDASLPLLVSVLVCPGSEDGCDVLNALQPQSYLTMAPGDDVVNTAEQLVSVDRCPVGETTVRVDLAVIGTVSDISTLRQTLTVACLPCEAGQALTHVDGTWTCKSCTETQYIVDNNDETVPCRDCPVGAQCDGNGLEGLNEGEVWTVDSAAGLMRLTQCPPGHSLINSNEGVGGPFAHAAQMCAACQVNQYIANQLSECQSCPLGGECDGKTVWGKVAGSEWVVQNNTIRLTACPPGYIIVRDEVLSALDQCVACPRGKYSLLAAVVEDPGPGEAVLLVSDPVEAASGSLCHECEDGADCEGGSAVVPGIGWWRRGGEELENVTVWEYDGSDRAEVYRCPPAACKADGRCANGRTGPVCGICISGWAMGNGLCSRCTYGLETFGILVYVAIGVAGITIYFVTSIQPLIMDDKAEAEAKGENHNICWRGWAQVQSVWAQLHGAEGGARLLLGYFKVMVSFFQMLSSFLYTFSVEWSPSMLRIMEVSGIFSFNVLAFPGPSCLAGRISHEGRLLIYTMIPLLVVFLLVAPGGIALLLGGRNMELKRKRKIIQTMVRPVQVWLFLTYPLMTYQTLSNFHCQHLSPDGEGEYLLISNYRIECPLRHPGGFLFLWSFFFGILYAGGIPFLFYFVLRQYEVPGIGAAKRLDEVTQELIAVFQKRHVHDIEALTSLCTLLTRTQKNMKHSFDLVTVRACCPALYKEVLQELDGSIDRVGLTEWLERRNALCVRRQLLRALFNAHANQGLLDKDGFTEVICRMVQENVLYDGGERFDELTDDQLKRLLACKWHASLGRAGPTREKTDLIRTLSTQASVMVMRMDSKKGAPTAPTPRDERTMSVFSIADSVVDFDQPDPSEEQAELEASESMKKQKDEVVNIEDSNEPGSVGWAQVPHDKDRMKQKRKEMEEGVRGSLWAFEGVPRERLEQRFVEMVKKLTVIGVLSHENLAWGNGGPKEELALDHLGFLFKGYRVGVWYWEVVELLRKLTFNALMVFIFPGSRAQLICGFSVAALFMLASAKFSPHKDKRVATLHFIASIALCVTLLYAISIRLLEEGPVAPGEAGLREFLSWLTILMIFFVLGFPAVMFIFNTDLNPFILWSRIFSGSHRVEQHGSHGGQSPSARAPLRLTARTYTSGEGSPLAASPVASSRSPMAASSPVTLQRRALPGGEAPAAEQSMDPDARRSVGAMDGEAEDQVVLAQPAVPDTPHRTDADDSDGRGSEGRGSVGGPAPVPEAASITPQPVPAWYSESKP